MIYGKKKKENQVNNPNNLRYVIECVIDSGLDLEVVIALWETRAVKREVIGGR